MVTVNGTIKQKGQKIFCISDKLLFGASGDIGIIQKNIEVITKYVNGITAKRQDQIKNMKDELNNIRNTELNYWRGLVSQVVAYQSVPAPVSDSLICIKHNNGDIKLWNINELCTDAFFNEYVCSGSGSTFAYTLLNLFYDKAADKNKGRLIAYMVVKETINTVSGGIGEPIDIWTLNKTSGECYQLTTPEMEALNSSYFAWKQIQSATFKDFQISP